MTPRAVPPQPASPACWARPEVTPRQSAECTTSSRVLLRLLFAGQSSPRPEQLKFMMDMPKNNYSRSLSCPASQVQRNTPTDSGRLAAAPRPPVLPWNFSSAGRLHVAATKANMSRPMSRLHRKGRKPNRQVISPEISPTHKESGEDACMKDIQEKLLQLLDDLCTSAELEDRVDGFKAILGNDFRVEHIF